MKLSAKRCSVCGADRWQAVPDPVADRAITTSGVLLREPLAKAQCESCGLLQRINADFVGSSDYYESRYADYYLRPGAETYDAPRYKAMTEWMSTGIGDFSPRTILDVGCGAGWSMLAMRAAFPDAVIEGVEPSAINAERARQAGFSVSVARIGDEDSPKKNYDLVYANNVLQHVLSPVEFLETLRDYLSEDSLLVLVCPDASSPSNEMLWCDHNHSFRPHDILRLAERAGYRVHRWLPHPDNITILDKQLVVLARRSGPHAPVGRPDRPVLTPKELYRQRCNYMANWRQVERALCDAVRDRSRTYNFGSSSWTWLLAGYCPQYWSFVDCCLVDGFAGYCLDKDVRPFADVTINPDDALVLGVNPVSQPAFAARFQTVAHNIIRWDGFVRS